jgi:hypothetical protein
MRLLRHGLVKGTLETADVLENLDRTYYLFGYLT